jgi:23S rRNA (uridine2552-2'-O)-methyltransferase
LKSHKWRDSHSVRAKKNGYPSRSVFKLEEIQERFHILKRGNRVLDLGCYPGSWLLFSSQAVGAKGCVVGVDLTPMSMSLPPNARFVRSDVLGWDASLLEALDGSFDVVLSDMAPSTTGRKIVDAQRSLQLCQSALALALQVLKPKGVFVCKIFHGPDFKGFSNQIKGFFGRVTHLKPQTTRKASKEIFIIALGKKRNADSSNG